MIHPYRGVKCVRTRSVRRKPRNPATPSLNAITLLKGERELRRRARVESGILEREWTLKGCCVFSSTDLVR